MHRAARICLAAAAVLPLADEARAERLAIRFLGPSEGLPHRRVKAVAEDPRGFLWFATPEGLGRFDGAAVRVYDRTDGLPVAGVNDLLVTRGGEYLLATMGAGVCRLEDGGGFSPVSLGRPGEVLDVLALHEDPAGRVWAGTDRGLFVRETGSTAFATVPIPRPGPVSAFADDPDGSLWVGAFAGLVRRLPDGRLLWYEVRGFGRPTRVRALAFDGAERLWVGHEYGLLVFRRPSVEAETGAGGSVRILEPRQVELGGFEASPDLPRSVPGHAVAYTAGDDLNRKVVRRILHTGDGSIWIAQVGRGLIHYDGSRFHRYDKRHGLRDDTLNDLHEDRAGGLWLASDAGGAMRIAWDGLDAFGAAEGLGHTFVTGLFEHPDGTLVSVAGDFHVNLFHGRGFRSVTRALPVGVHEPSFWSQGFLTRSGEWWLPTAAGLHRFGPTPEAGHIARAVPRATYTAQNGVQGSPSRIFEDASGDLWLAVSGGPAPLLRWRRSADAFQPFGVEDGLPAGAITAFAESASGDLWIGFEKGGLARRRDDRGFQPADLDARGTVTALHFDAAGRLWIATHGAGLIRVDDPRGSPLQGRTYTRAQGLASESVRCLAEDRFGRIYAGTARGIHRWSPGGERLERLPLADALTNDEIQVALRDRHGDLWFGTVDGLLRLRPRRTAATPPPRVFIGGVRAAGEAWPVAALGAAAVPPLELEAGASHLRIDYFAIPFVPGDEVHYAHRLLGADERWTEAGAQRSVTFARLAPGRYTFQVRATGAAGAHTSPPAELRLTVHPPLWRTWWFLAAWALLVTAAGWRWHRSRMSRALAVERLRTRIATDLHDDIGSNLSQVAILSEVVLARRREDGDGAAESLTRIAELSRETIETMSDIVWAIDPRRDQLGDLVLRMRRFANDLFAGREVQVRVSAPPAGLDRRLGSDVKRQIYLIFKECLHNAARHSSCSRLDVELTAEGDALRLLVRDDGRGFDPEHAAPGSGLASLRSRAQALGGGLAIGGGPGQGTEVILLVHVGRAGRRRSYPWRT